MAKATRFTNVEILKNQMIYDEMYKLVYGLYDSSSCIALEFSHMNTRGNRFKVVKNQFYHDAHKYFVVGHVVTKWNSLPDATGTSTSMLTITLINFGQIKR